MSKTHHLYWVNMGCAIVAAILWYVWPQLGAWPLVLGAVPLLLRFAVPGRERYRSRFDLPILLFLLTALLSVWSAYDRPAAWAKFWVILAGALLFYAFVNTNHTNGHTFSFRNGQLLALFGSGVAVYFLATHDWVAFPAKIGFLTSFGEAIQAPLPTLPGHRLHPNVVGGILAMMLPFAGGWAWLAWREGVSRPGKILSILSIITIGFGLFMTTSRGAWLAAFLAVGMVGLWWLVGRTRPGKEAIIISTLVGTIVGLFIIVLLLFPAPTQTLLNQLPGLGGEFSRVELFRSTMLLVQDYPFIGAGLDGFMMLYSSYSFLIHVGYIVHAHNLYLDIAVEQGLIGLLAFGWMLAVTWRWWLKKTWSSVDRESVIPAMALLSLFTVLFHGLVDDALFGSRAVLLLFVPFAFVKETFQVSETWKVFSRRFVVVHKPNVWLGIGALGLLILFSKPLLSAFYANLGTVHQSRMELSIYSWPEWSVQDEVRQAHDLSVPVDYFERSLALNPDNLVANRRLGMIHLSLGEYELARDRLAIVYTARPGNNTIKQLYGEALLATGRVEEGTNLWQTVNNERDQLTLRAFWYEFIGDEERLAIMRSAIDS